MQNLIGKCFGDQTTVTTDLMPLVDPCYKTLRYHRMKLIFLSRDFERIVGCCSHLFADKYHSLFCCLTSHLLDVLG